ncbi:MULTISPECIES: fimbrial protein [Providencia]|uniref:Type 1 fimbrial protein n=1 Tax=Providencia stuartii TaxID=588 RepID=A0AAI9MXC9_PROST|nr:MULTISPECIES: fimbrial protein [Providencia]ELR5045092.1 type 1 fimbrial protein [Providencia rettgeri]ELR5037643.1 type 1 fimbrial protein [Providencia stuartii]ELR5290158.1 type 1 fimbrial protein [Providencia stuartii]MCR4178549.1 type 1 fimbrial protein [Providencia vermicola]URE79792.1 type 1 fimbrial protein [Providencia stuartii]
MKLKFILPILLLSVSAVGNVYALRDQGHGQIKFKGSIIDAPCSISPETKEIIELGQISNMALVIGGKSTPRPFEILLENCDVSKLTKGVQLTFSGAAASFDTTNKTLGIVGTGSGAGIQIANGSAGVITLGQPTPFQKIQNNNNTLQFSAYLVGNGGDIDTITVGEFSSVADFTLNYE